MSEKSEDKSLSKDLLHKIGPQAKLKNKYMTRKKVIDFAKIGEKLSLTGSSCHFCKNIMTVQYSNACRNTTQKTPSKKKTCNKKFCYDCLQKYFITYWNKRSDILWKCPCCQNQCSCNQCKKIWIKSNNFKNNMVKDKNDLTSIKINENSPNDLSTKKTTSIANSHESINNFNGINSGKDVVLPVNDSYSNIYTNKSNNSIENKFSLFNNKPKIDIITEKDFLTYKRSLDEYFSVLDKYNEYFDKLNIQKIKKNK